MRIEKVKEIIEAYTDYTIKAVIVPHENGEYLLIKDKGNRFEPFRVDELSTYSSTGNHAPEILKEIYKRMSNYIASEYMEGEISSKFAIRLSCKVQNDLRKKYEWLETFKPLSEIATDVYKILINSKFGIKSEEVKWV